MIYKVKISGTVTVQTPDGGDNPYDSCQECKDEIRELVAEQVNPTRLRVNVQITKWEGTVTVE